MSQKGTYPAVVLAKLSSMMFDLMRLAEQIEAHELARSAGAPPEPREPRNYCEAANVVPFRRPGDARREMR
jgi:hypothetical protein